MRTQYERTARALPGDDDYGVVATRSVLRGPDEILRELLGSSGQGA
ncbi:hypothetical protein [Streptomyces sp. NPDC058964]